MEPLKVVLAGCGGVSDGWLSALTSYEDVVVAGLVDLDPSRPPQAASKHGISGALLTDNLSEALTTVKPDIVCDCTLPGAHHDVVIAGLQHGCHVFGEKPMAETMDQAHRMAAAASKAGKTYAVMQNRRYLPDIVRCRNFLKSGAVGNLSTVHADFFIGAHFGGFRESMDHVLVLDMAIHTFDQARYLSDCDPVSVYCHEFNPVGSWYRHGASATAIFEMTNGVVFTYRGSWCSEGLNTSWESSWRLIGTHGSVLWDGGPAISAQAVASDSGFIRQQKSIEIPPAPSMQATAHAGCIRDMLDCVKEGRKPQTSYDDNIKSLAMVHGAIESASSGKKVHVRV